jgi:hypothetical protein
MTIDYSLVARGSDSVGVGTGAGWLASCLTMPMPMPMRRYIHMIVSHLSLVASDRGTPWPWSMYLGCTRRMERGPIVCPSYEFASELTNCLSVVECHRIARLFFVRLFKMKSCMRFDDERTMDHDTGRHPPIRFV